MQPTPVSLVMQPASPRFAGESTLVEVASDPESLPIADGVKVGLSEFVAATAWLAAEGLSLGLAGWEILNADRVVDYVVRNQIPDRGSFLSTPVESGFAGALGLVGIAGLWVAAKGASGLELLHRLARRCAPLVLAGMVPLSWNWRVWRGRELPFLVFAAVLIFALKHLLEVAARSASPLAYPHPIWERLLVLVRGLSADMAQCARLLPRWLPTLLVCLGALGYAVFFSYQTIVHHRNVLSTSLDLGVFDNLFWNAAHGGRLLKASPQGGPDSTHLGHHATWFVYVAAPVYWLRPNAETILALQASFLGGAALPLYLLGRRYVTAWTACLVSFIYLLYAPLHGSNLYDFHDLVLGTFFLWWTVYFVDKRRIVLALLSVLLVCSVREDTPFSLAILGAFLLFTGRRPKTGAALVMVGLVYFYVIKSVVMRRAMGGQESFLDQYQSLIAPGERGISGAVQTLLSNPGYTLANLVHRDKLIYLLEIMLPLAFFPLRRPIGLLLAVPGLLFTLLGDHHPLIQISFQYTTYWIAMLFPAMLVNLRWLSGTAEAAGVAGRAWKRGWMVAIVAGALVTSHQLGAVFQQHTANGGFGPYHFGTTSEDLERRDALHKLLAMVPPTAKIVSSENIVPQVSNRADAYTLRAGLYDAEYLLFSTPSWTDERSHILEGLRPGTFGVVATSGKYVLAKRGHPTDKNAPVIARVEANRE